MGLFKPVKTSEINSYLSQISNDYRFKSLTEYINKFIELYKSQSKFKSFDNLHKFIINNTPYLTKFGKTKINTYFKIAKVILNEYQDKLNQSNSIDFNDMITIAVEKIKSGEYKCNYDYVIVDEFQNISQKRLEFLQTIQSQSNTKIFCVEDDWQSIYVFSGIDASLFYNFDFIDKGEPLYIESTHRNFQELVDIAGNFIMKIQFN